MNVIELLEKNRIRYTTGHKDVRGGWAGLECPWCGRNGELYLGINLSSGRGNCWRCGPHSLADIIAACTGVPLRQAIEAARGLSLPRVAARRQAGGKLVQPGGVGPLLPVHRRYLRGRKFDPDELVRLWGIQSIGLAVRFPWSIYIPIHNFDGEEVSWVTRSIGTGPRRYHGAKPEEEVTPAKEILYGAQYCRHTVIVHEGPTDVWATGPGAASVLGLSVTQPQIDVIASFLVRVICFDNEPEAQRRAERLARKLAPFPGRTEVVTLETGKDTASAEPAEVAELRAAYLNSEICARVA